MHVGQHWLGVVGELCVLTVLLPAKYMGLRVILYHRFSTINDLSHYSSTYGSSGTDSGFVFSNLHFPQAV